MSKFFSTFITPFFFNLGSTKDIFSADFASLIAKKGVPFRDAYKKVKGNVSAFFDENLVKNNHLFKSGKGEPWDKEMKNVLEKRLEVLSKELNVKKKEFNNAISDLISIAKNCD